MSKNDQTLMKDENLVPIQFIGNKILTGSVEIADTDTQELLLPANTKSMSVSIKAAAGNANNIFIGTAGNVLYPLLPEEEKVMLHDNGITPLYVKGTAGETVLWWEGTTRRNLPPGMWW